MYIFLKTSTYSTIIYKNEKINKNNKSPNFIQNTLSYFILIVLNIFNILGEWGLVTYRIVPVKHGCKAVPAQCSYQ